jgi:hypothetical protein
LPNPFSDFLAMTAMLAFDKPPFEYGNSADSVG